MKEWHLSLFVLVSVIFSTACQHSSPPEHRRGGTLDGSEQWGYATPRGGVHMFWWLYHTTHPDGILERPLLIWIQVLSLSSKLLDTHRPDCVDKNYKKCNYQASLYIAILQTWRATYLSVNFQILFILYNL